MTEILLLGTFHFGESNIDFTSTDIQKQLEAFARRLAEFCPDTVAIELADHEQEIVSSSYEKFQLEDLKNPKKICAGLGEICMFGNTRLLSYTEEAVQIGYRLAKMLSLPKIHAIDIDSGLSGELETVYPFLGETIGMLGQAMTEHANDSLMEQYKYYNTEFSALNHRIYLKANSVQINGEYIGSKLVTSWYERNLKIYSNLQRLAQNSKRLFVVYGAGHLQILRDLIQADPNFKLVDVTAYL